MMLSANPPSLATVGPRPGGPLTGEALAKFRAAAKASLASGPGEIQLTPEEVQMEPLLRANPDR